MRHINFFASTSSYFLQNISQENVIASIKGATTKLGEQYNGATVVLYNKANLQPLMIKRTDKNGSYQFLGLNNKLNLFIVAFDNNQQYNAVIQDNVIPK